MSDDNNPPIRFLTVPRAAALTGLALLVGAVVFYYVFRPLDAAACVGRSDLEIFSRIGHPDKSMQGNYGAPSPALVAGRRNVQTLIWVRQSGRLYASFSNEGGTAVCFRADWLPSGSHP